MYKNESIKKKIKQLITNKQIKTKIKLSQEISDSNFNDRALGISFSCYCKLLRYLFVSSSPKLHIARGLHLTIKQINILEVFFFSDTLGRQYLLNLIELEIIN